MYIIHTCLYVAIIKNWSEIIYFSISYRSSIKKVLAEPYTDQSILDKAECMDLVKYDLAIVTMEISVSTYSEMVREEATSIGNAHCSPNNSNLLIISIHGTFG